MFIRGSEKNTMNRPATLYEILLVKISKESKDQIKKHYHKMSLLTHPDAGETKNSSRPSTRHIKF